MPRHKITTLLFLYLNVVFQARAPEMVTQFYLERVSIGNCGLNGGLFPAGLWSDSLIGRYLL